MCARAEFGPRPDRVSAVRNRAGAGSKQGRSGVGAAPRPAGLGDPQSGELGCAGLAVSHNGVDEQVPHQGGELVGIVDRGPSG
jgi:hypothetical protein